MADSLEKLREELDEEFEQVRKNLTDIRTRMDAVEKAAPIDDLSQLLEDLEDAVKAVRTGGLVGSGANGHARARKKFLDAQGLKAD
jgi:uncharacterized coiled-coil DUF342 family protein